MLTQAPPPSILNAVVGLLSPYSPGLSPSDIVHALESLRQPLPRRARPDTRLESPRNFGRFLGMSEFSVRRRIADGTIPAVRIGGVLRIPLDALDSLVERAANGAAVQRQVRGSCASRPEC